MRIFKVVMFVIFFIGLIKNYDAQEISNERKITKPFIILNVPYASHTIQQKGWALKYNFPGFISLLFGEISINYKDSSYNSYTFAIGMPYLLLGYNKSLSRVDNSIYYANFSLGVLVNGYFLGSAGISYLIQPNNSFAYEFTLTTFFNDGMAGGSFLPVSVANYNTRGLLGNVVLSKYFFESLVLSFSCGISYTAFQYAKRKNTDLDIAPYYYIRKETIDERPYCGELKWKGHLLFSLGITVAYHL